MKVRRASKLYRGFRVVTVVPEGISTPDTLLKYALTLKGSLRRRLLAHATEMKLDGNLPTTLNFQGAGGLRPKRKARRIGGGKK